MLTLVIAIVAVTAFMAIIAVANAFGKAFARKG